MYAVCSDAEVMKTQVHTRLLKWQVRRNISVVILCFGSLTPTYGWGVGTGAKSCRVVHRQDAFLDSESLFRIQKEIAGNRPLLAILRGSKKDPKLGSVLVFLIQSMPDLVQSQFSQQTGFEIENGQLVQRRETKISSKEWLNQFNQLAVELIQSKSGDRSAEPRNGTRKNSALLEVEEISKEQLQSYHKTRTDHVIERYMDPKLRAELPNSAIESEYREMIALDFFPLGIAELYFLKRDGFLIDPDGTRIHRILGERTPERMRQAYVQFRPNRVGIFAHKSVPQLIEAFQSHIRSYLSNLNREILRFKSSEYTRAKILREQDALDRARIENPEVRSSSLKELISDLDSDSVKMVSRHLSELIESVDSSDRQKEKTLQAQQDPKPQLRLLELAYQLKKLEDLTQKEIQAAVYSALDKITEPPKPIAEALNDVSDEAGRSIERSDNSSRMRQEKLEQKLAAESELLLSVHNQREFFEVFKPGTVGFGRLEADFETLREKFGRVADYFTMNPPPQILVGDGHFSRDYRRIFSTRWGDYRMLVTVETLEAGKRHLVVLSTYHKNDAKNQSKESHFYEMAEKRRLQGGY